MNYVIAKVKEKEKRNDSEFVKLYAEVELYSLPLFLNNAIPYEPTRLLDEDEWFKIENFSETVYCLEILKFKFRTTDYCNIKRTDIDSIEYIISYQEGDYFFQRIFKNNILVKKSFTIGDRVSFNKGEKSIVINDLPDAIYRKQEDVLYFKKLQTVAPIFKGIDILYKEATREETEGFLRNDFIKLAGDYNVDKVQKMNRKRIGMAIDILDGFDKKQRKDVLDYTHQYYPDLKYNEKKRIFTISNEEDLKVLLWGIEQRYYTTPITKENRVANSVSVLAI